MKNRFGFTLIELLIVLAILAMLAALVGPALFGNLIKGKRVQALTQIGSFETALDSYRLDVGAYPDSLNDLVSDSGDLSWNGPYLGRRDAVPLDPWGNEYHYEATGRSFELMAYGADGEPGGQDNDADIGN